MRKSFTYGSVRGAAGDGGPYRDCSSSYSCSSLVSRSPFLQSPPVSDNSRHDAGSRATSGEYDYEDEHEHERRSIWRADVGKAEASGLDLQRVLLPRYAVRGATAEMCGAVGGVEDHHVNRVRADTDSTTRLAERALQGCQVDLS